MSFPSACAAFVLVTAALVPVTGAALAAGPNEGPYLNRPTPATGLADAGRSRARAGDCKGALDLFDAALRTSTDPTLHRDRGFCHEQLNQPFPAIDDYRSYLVAYPEGPDAEQVRQRLERLEQQNGVHGQGKPAPATTDQGPKASGSVSMSINNDGVSGSTDGTNSAAKSRRIEDVEADEKLAQVAYASPLRVSTGWIIGPYFGFRRYTRESFANSQAVGAAIRYAWSNTSTFVAEIGYVSVNATGTASSLGGMGLFAGYEARFPLSKYMSDAFIVGGGLGYERYSQSSTGIVFNAMLPRARAGYRHVFGSSIGLEVTGDGGVAYLFAKDVTLDSPVVGVFGAYVALVVGF